MLLTFDLYGLIAELELIWLWCMSSLTLFNWRGFKISSFCGPPYNMIVGLAGDDWDLFSLSGSTGNSYLLLINGFIISSFDLFSSFSSPWIWPRVGASTVVVFGYPSCTSGSISDMMFWMPPFDGYFFIVFSY